MTKLKTGPELFTVTPEMLHGIETLAKQFKAIRDDHNYDFLVLIKTALSKYPSMVDDAHKIIATGTEAIASIKKFVELTEQIFPKT